MDYKRYIIGAGAQALEIRDYLETEGYKNPIFLVEKKYADAAPDAALVLGQETDLQVGDGRVIIGIGAPGARRDLESRYSTLKFFKFISKSAFLSEDVKVAEGSLISPMVAVTVNTAIGKHVIVNIGATISHDCHIGDYCTVSPGVHMGGRVRLGRGVFVGIGAVIKNNISIADGSVIGAGSVVINDINIPNSVVVGCPAKQIKINTDWLYEI